MTYYYEFIQAEAILPVKAFIHSIDKIELHWHEHMEFIMALKGSINIKVDEDQYVLNAGDFILINSNQVHSIYKTGESNLLLAVQINPDFFLHIYPHWNEIYFYCHSFFEDTSFIRHNREIKKHLAQIMLEISRQQPGYRARIGSNLFSLAYQLFNYPYHRLEDMESRTTNEDLRRLHHVVEYINQNLHRQITLKEIGKELHLSYHYLSRFIQDKMGISFQTYLNQLRLQKATELLLTSDKSINEIAQKIGFTSPAALYKLFKKEFNVTPGDYKDAVSEQYIAFNPKMTNSINNDKNTSGLNNERAYLNINRQAVLKILFAFLDPEDEEKHKTELNPISGTMPVKYISLAVDTQKKGRKNCFYWRRLIGSTRAAEGLRQNLQQQLREMQNEIGFEQIRFHGILADEMMIYQKDPAGNTLYNWTYVNNLFDSLLEANLKPFIGLGFMPRDPSCSDETMFWWKANTAPLKDINQWTALVSAFVRHCMNRYGPEQVAGWYFEVWNESELKSCFRMGTKQEYFDFYRATALAVKAASPRSPVGGPAIAHEAVKDSTWLKDFLVYCKENKVPLDFVSLHIYPEHFPADFEIKQWEQKLQNDTLSSVEKSELLDRLNLIYHGPDHTYQILQSARAIIEKTLGYLPQICITKWNASAFNRNLIHDTAYVAAFIIHHIVHCQGLADMLCYWTFTDINGESPLGAGHFHGNFGLINKDGIKKASYYAYYLLAKLGNEILEQGDGYIVTKNCTGIQIMIYNYAYFDPLFLKGDTSPLTSTDRYKVFADKPEQHITITITGVTGPYRVTRYRLNRSHGSAFDLWVEMGAPEQMSAQEIKYLKKSSYPRMQVQNTILSGRYQEKVVLPVHGVELILLQKNY